MDELVQASQYSTPVGFFDSEHMLIPSFSDHNPVNGLKFSHLIPNYSNQTNSAPSPTTWPHESNVSEAILNHINRMLMADDDDWENRPDSIQHSLALQEAEKSLLDVLHNPPRTRENVQSPDEDLTWTCNSPRVNISTSIDTIVDSNLIRDRNNLRFSPVQYSGNHHNLDYVIQSDLKTFGSLSNFGGTVDSLANSFQVLDPSQKTQPSSKFALTLPRTPRVLVEGEKNFGENLPCQSRGTKNHYKENDDYSEAGRSNKQLASYDEDSDDQSGMYEVLLSPAMNPYFHKEESLAYLVYGVCGMPQKNWHSKESSGRKTRGKKQGNRKELVDLITLLTQCAQAVSRTDSRAAYRLLKQIWQHSSPYGNGTERMAHYLANALEARLAGTGRALDTPLLSKRLTAAESLAAYVAYATASPFKRMSNFFANKMIWKLAEKATRLHIIDFGIIHGFQWPGLFQHLSLRSGGPPSVRLTGIDFPQPGFRPAERVDETGRRLAYYCERFRVPFEFNGVAKQWDTIRLEDLKIRRDEMLVVNCSNRLRFISDEIVGEESPRDAILKLIRRIDPDMFIHSIVHGSYNAPFFLTRFQEVLFYLCSKFDMFDAILSREDQGRILHERDILGRVAMSVVACEGTERIIRPETYRQWQIRNIRAGLRQLPLDHEIVEDVKAKVKLGYHKDFVVNEDSNWLLQGWKGRIFDAISCWEPAQE